MRVSFPDHTFRIESYYQKHKFFHCHSSIIENRAKRDEK